MKTKRTVDIMIIIVLLMIVVGAYFIFVKKDEEPAEAVIVERPTAISPEAEHALLLLSQLKDLKIKGDLFESDAFRSLTDNHILIDTETKGREDPFAPFGSLGKSE